MVEQHRLRITVRIESVDDGGRSTLLAGKSGLTRETVTLSLDGFKAKPATEGLTTLLEEVGGEAIEAAIETLCDAIASGAPPRPPGRARAG